MEGVGGGGGRESIIFPFQQNIRNGEVSPLFLFPIVGSLKAVYTLFQSLDGYVNLHDLYQQKIEV